MILDVDLTDKEALAFAQYLKRSGIYEYLAIAKNEPEAYDMQNAGEKIAQALADKGVTPE